MTAESSVDYQAALDVFRREEHIPDNPVRSPERILSAPVTEGYVDYLAVVKKWDKAQAGKYVIYTEEHENEGKL